MDGVAERGEGRLLRRELGNGGDVERCQGVGEGRVSNLRHLAAQGLGEALGDVLVGEAGEGEQVGKLREGGLGGEVEAENDADAAELGAGGVDGRDEAVDALADVDDDDSALDGSLDDLSEAAVDTPGHVAHAKRLEDESAKIGQVKDGVDHLGLDAGEDAQTGDMGGVKVAVDGEAGDAGGSENERPVYADAEPVDVCEGLAVRAGKGLEGGGGDLCGAVAAVELLVEVEADLGDDKGSGDDEGAEEVIDGVALEGEDGGLGASKDDGLAEVGEHEGEGGGGVS